MRPEYEIEPLSREQQREPKEVLEQLVAVALVGLEQGPQQVREEAQWGGLDDVEAAFNLLLKANPKSVLLKFIRQNPSLNLRRLDQENPLSVALALVHLAGGSE